MASGPLQVAGVKDSPDHYIAGRRVGSAQRFALHCPIDQVLLGDIAKGGDWSFEFFCDIKDVVVPAKPFRARLSQR
jgi:hypothetical protein